MNRLGSGNLYSDAGFADLDADVRSNYLMNTSLQGISDADVILLIGSNPRVEAPVLNARYSSVLSARQRMTRAAVCLLLLVVLRGSHLWWALLFGMCLLQSHSCQSCSCSCPIERACLTPGTMQAAEGMAERRRTCLHRHPGRPDLHPCPAGGGGSCALQPAEEQQPLAEEAEGGQAASGAGWPWHPAPLRQGCHPAAGWAPRPFMPLWCIRCRAAIAFDSLLAQGACRCCSWDFSQPGLSAA